MSGPGRPGALVPARPTLTQPGFYVIGSGILMPEPVRARPARTAPSAPAMPHELCSMMHSVERTRASCVICDGLRAHAIMLVDVVAATVTLYLSNQLRLVASRTMRWVAIWWTI